MGVILILILASLGVASLFLGGFIWAVRSGQFEDTFTPSVRILTEEESKPLPLRSPAAPAPAAGNCSKKGVRPGENIQKNHLKES